MMHNWLRMVHMSCSRSLQREGNFHYKYQTKKTKTKDANEKTQLEVINRDEGEEEQYHRSFGCLSVD